MDLVALACEDDKAKANSPFHDSKIWILGFLNFRTFVHGIAKRCPQDMCMLQKIALELPLTGFGFQGVYPQDTNLVQKIKQLNFHNNCYHTVCQGQIRDDF